MSSSHGVRPYTQPAPYFGQWGEDRWIVENLRLPNRGVFVDIGAGDGTRGSNTRHFEELGWSGLCVEPDPRNQAALTARRCTVLACAVASSPGRQVFSMYDDRPSRSGLGERGTGYTTTTVDCRTLDDLLTTSRIDGIDLLSIDVEGDELDVWHSLGSSRPPPGVIVVEYDDRRSDRATSHIHAVLGTDRYELLHRTPANLILRSRTEPGRRWPDA